MMPTPTKSEQCYTAMVIDDDEFSFENLRAKLRHMDVTTVIWANNGRAAINMLDAMAKPPDLVICDIFMPEVALCSAGGRQ